MFNWFRKKNKNMVNSCFQPIYLKDGDEDWHKLYDVYWYFENGFYHIVPVIKSASIIRQENILRNIDLPTRRKLFNRFVAFTKKLDIMYVPFIIDKKHIEDVTDMSGKLSKEISNFIRNNNEYF